MRVLIAGIGYPFLRDMSVGPELVAEFQRLDWPEGVEVDDWSVGAIGIIQQLGDLPRLYDRIVLVASVERGRSPGQVTRYQWHGAPPDDDEIQRRVGEALMGVISLDNMLIIGRHFGVLPSDVVVVEVEPEDTGWGPGFTPRIQGAMDEARAIVRRAALEGHDG